MHTYINLTLLQFLLWTIIKYNFCVCTIIDQRNLAICKAGSELSAIIFERQQQHLYNEHTETDWKQSSTKRKMYFDTLSWMSCLNNWNGILLVHFRCEILHKFSKHKPRLGRPEQPSSILLSYTMWNHYNLEVMCEMAHFKSKTTKKEGDCFYFDTKF